MTSSTYYDRLKLFEEMERQFEDKNEKYFEDLLNHPDSVVRTRAVCILADIAGENGVKPIGKVLKHDDNSLVRHEAAFSLGIIGSEDARNTLNQALRDESEEVRESAVVALANLDYVSKVHRNNKFTRMTGG